MWKESIKKTAGLFCLIKKEKKCFSISSLSECLIQPFSNWVHYLLFSSMSNQNGKKIITYILFNPSCHILNSFWNSIFISLFDYTVIVFKILKICHVQKNLSSREFGLRSSFFESTSVSAALSLDISLHPVLGDSLQWQNSHCEADEPRQTKNISR